MLSILGRVYGCTNSVQKRTKRGVFGGLLVDFQTLPAQSAKLHVLQSSQNASSFCQAPLHTYKKCVVCLSPFFVFTSGRGLTFTSAHILVRAPIDGPASQSTDTEDPALTLPLAVLPPHVCHRQETGLPQLVAILIAPARPNAPHASSWAFHL